MPAEQGFNSFISLHTIGLSYHRNTQPAKFSAFGIIGPVPSVARAANPADTLTSIGECVLSIEVTEILKAAVLPVAQFVNRRSAGCMWLWLAVRSLPVSTWTPRWAQWFQPEHHEGCCVVPQHHPHVYKWCHDVQEGKGQCQGH